MTAVRKRVERINPSTSVTDVAGQPVKIRMGTASVSEKDAPGGAPQSIHNLLAIPVIRETASDLAMPEKEIHRVLYAAGRVMQRLLLQGRAVGIPYVGALNVVETRVDWAKEKNDILELADKMEDGTVGGTRIGKNPDALARSVLKMRGWVPPSRRRVIKFRTSQLLRRMFQDNCIHCGGIKDQVQDILRAESVAKGKPLPNRYKKRLPLRGQTLVDKTGNPVSQYFEE